MKKDIYIIKNSVNDKVYIGQAKNAAERWLSHIYNATYEAKTNKNVQVIHKAMAKYGYDKFHYEILEHQIENFDEREQYWIDYYNSCVPNGYNVAPGGKSAGTGILSPIAIFKTAEELGRCISEISSSTKSFSNIARKYGCSYEVISAINSGKRYRRDSLSYPLRNTNAQYDYDTLKQVRYSLKYECDLTLKDIATKYNIDCSQVSKINQGKIYYVYGEEYPLRKKRKTDMDNCLVDMVIEDIKHSNLSLSEIAVKYNISRVRVTNINQGVYYHRDSIHYPLREEGDPRNKSLKKFLDRDEIKSINDLLKTNMSINEIANRFDVSKTTIYNINSGKCKKYILPDQRYPIRKI